MSEQALLGLADDELVLGWRDSEWTGIAPMLEEDVAFSSIAQNEIGHARAVYELLVGADGDADALAFDRKPEEYRCAPLVELHLLEWAHTIARRWLYEVADEIRITALKDDSDPAVAGLAAKIDREEAYHRMHAEMWHDRLRDEPRFQAAVEELWPYALGVLPAELRGELVSRVGLDEVDAIERGTHTDELAPALGGDDDRAALRTGGCAVVGEAQVWEALEEIPDPEIPVVSLVDLGVIRSVDVANGHVRIEFTPTFLGCPALEFMKRAMEEKVTELGAEPEVEVISDDSWSTDRITPGRPREAARRGLRAAGAAGSAAPEARPAAGERLPLPLLRLDRDAPREHLRPDAVPLAALLRELPPAVRAVQDDLTRKRQDGPGLLPASTRRHR